MKIEQRLKDLEITLPEVARPVASYTPAVLSGIYVFVSGQLPLVGGRLKFEGRVGREVSLDEARECARIAALNCLAAVRDVVGSLDRIRQIVRVTGYVRSGEDFRDHPRVLNGASDLLLEIFGDEGVHVRSAVGCGGLPLGAPVEVEMIVEVWP
ncbi:MAG: RidA family protein [Syntrophorhabdales bacterium]|jgi:enamine deaminase RidA (YjgF/YER057c/UK114 family)